jgi:DNA-binding transcriptional regulator YdaS (Cro superfamily)
MSKQMIALRKLSKIYDYNRGKIAEGLGVEIGAVYMWFARGKISKQGAVMAEKATNGKIKAAQLRPDIEEFKGV